MALKGKQNKLDKNKDGKISGADFKMMKDGGKVEAVKPSSKNSSNQSRGGGAAIAGTSFSGVK